MDSRFEAQLLLGCLTMGNSPRDLAASYMLNRANFWPNLPATQGSGNHSPSLLNEM